MATTTQRYFPTAFTVIANDITWASGQAAVSGSVADWATANIPSGQTADALIFRDFDISIPAGNGITAVRCFVTGAVYAGEGDELTMTSQLYSDGAVIGNASIENWSSAGSFTGTFNIAAARHTITGSDNYWGTNVALTNAILAASGFGLKMEGRFIQGGQFPSNTGVARIASVALEVDYEPIAMRRNGGSTIYRLGGSTIKQ